MKAKGTATTTTTTMATKFAAVAKGKRKHEDGEEPSSVLPLRRNRQRVLMVPSRGVTSQMRHLIADLEALLPHSKRDAKLDTKQQLHVLNELAELNNCNNTLFFEARKHLDLYMWMSKAPNGPSVKLQVNNIHTMDELKMTGNCLKGSRHIVTFDVGFDAQPHLQLIKEMLTQTFAVPASSRRTKPFVDHVISFSFLDGKIWFRNFQIVEPLAHENESEYQEMLAAEVGAHGNGKKGKRTTTNKNGEPVPIPAPTLTEIGPRFVLTPIKIFEGSFSGAVLFDNPEYVSPNAIRSANRRKKATKYADTVESKEKLQEKREAFAPVEDELSVRRVFA